MAVFWIGPATDALPDNKRATREATEKITGSNKRLKRLTLWLVIFTIVLAILMCVLVWDTVRPSD